MPIIRRTRRAALLCTTVLALGAGLVPAAAQQEPPAARADVAASQVSVTQSEDRRGAGTEDRKWVEGQQADPTSPERFDVDTEVVWVTMRDGVRLEGELRLPDLDGAAAPCVLMANGYGWDGAIGDAFSPQVAALAERGYATLHVSLRGSGDSEGEANLYNRFGDDGYDLVEWMADQSWCDGNVGMIGASLLGISQWLTAKAAPPHLEAIIPYVACGDCYNYLWYPGGMLPGPGRVARGEPEYSSASAHRDFDQWWRERTTTAQDHAAIARSGIAVMDVGGWEDYISPANVRAYEEFDAAGGDGMFISGPWAHGASPGSGPVGPHDYLTYQALWLDHTLRGIDNGITAEGEALIYVQGANQWRFEEQWPIPDTRTATLFLKGERSGSIRSRNDGSLSAVPPGPGARAASYRYDPDTGPFLPTLRDSRQGITDIDQRPYEQDALTWTTGELSESAEVTGSLALSFWARATGDTDFVVQLSDVAPDGTSTQVSSGYLNASRYPSAASPDEPSPEEVRQYELEIWPTSYVFAEGHRLRISLAGGSQVAPGQTAPQGPGVNPEPASVQIYQSAGYPASLRVPVIGTALLPSER
jgi:predicted acyl esterase